jgi:CRP/FNR family cyclic AMP-dependent transcriptional regulator
VHESGHVLFRPFGELTMLIMVSGFEVLFPLAAGVVFLLRRRDVVASAVCCGWTASALASAATYIADADDGRLALLGATGPDAACDWERILGQEFFDRVYLADSIAGTVRTVGYVLWFVALGLAAGRSCGTAGGNGLRSRSPTPGNRDPEAAASRAGRRTDVAVAADRFTSRVEVRCSGVGPRELSMAGSTVMIEWLRQVPLFSACSNRELRAIAAVAKDVIHPEGTVIATEGDPGVGLFLIVDGEAEVTIGGKRMAILRRGDFFGEIALLDGGPRSATVTARSDMRLLGLTEWVFRGLLQEHPSIAVKTLEAMAGRLRAATQAATA